MYLNNLTRVNSLADMNFSDLMILPDGRNFLRHADGYDALIIETPIELQQDILALKKELQVTKTDMEFLLRYQAIPYRVAVINTINGKGFFLRRPKLPIANLDDLGFSDAMVETLKKLSNLHGVVLFSGATGSGKSTSIYALLLHYIYSCGDIIVAIEDPPEIPMQDYYIAERKKGGLWYQIDAKKVGGYEAAMQAAMRYNPRFIFIGEIRDSNVAYQAIRAAINGHLVLSSIHAPSITGAILALQQLAITVTGNSDLARSILADGLIAVIHQQLTNAKINNNQRQLFAQILYLGSELGLRHKIRTGKIEQLNHDIEIQMSKISQGISLIQ